MTRNFHDDESDVSGDRVVDDSLVMEAEDSKDDRNSDLDQVEASFPHFCRLPIELRHRVWESFDVDLRAPSRVFDFNIDKEQKFEVWENTTLEQQTAPARAILATHRESRKMALTFYPDEAIFRNGQGVIRCNKDNDVIMLRARYFGLYKENWEGKFDLLKGVKHLGLQPAHAKVLADIKSYTQPGFHVPFPPFPSIKTLYYCLHSDWLPPNNIKWCTADWALEYYVNTEEESPGLGENMETMYCWPNLARHGEAAKRLLPKLDAEDDLNGGILKVAGRKIWPMIRFSFDTGMRRYEILKRANAAEGE
ncbi:hypothetical protein BJ170DRAFT_681136 [Xylariales sp. AK1849]|nr:hypothetical protein BJ170DRAFT_681136 [Xylariales sp. AK1849]